MILMIRLWAAIFISLVGLAMLVMDNITPGRLLGAAFAALGLSALFLVWRGRRVF